LESGYLLTAPAVAFAGLWLVLGGVGAGTVVSLVPGSSRVPGAPRLAGALLASARWFADLERWRIAKLRSWAGGGRGGAGRSEGVGDWRAKREAPASAFDPELWLDVAHAVALLPVALVTAFVTGVWWFVGIGASTAALRSHARYFGARYAWISVECARNTRPKPDQPVYQGPFDHRTAAPVLVIGDFWDPVTSYGNAVKVARAPAQQPPGRRRQLGPHGPADRCTRSLAPRRSPAAGATSSRSPPNRPARRPDASQFRPGPARSKALFSLANQPGIIAAKR
jgi:Putative sensor